MKFDAEEIIEGFCGDIIHPMNKTARVLIDSPFWSHHQRRNVLLLGDSRGDVHMADGLEVEQIIRIGFLNVHVEDALDIYIDLYDVVLTNDASLSPVENLLEQIVTRVKNEGSF
ncbi:hypothetical protein V7S43_018106 [Phytophthora oleae]|uniref:5'-nucleotidase n=1 Tax=Phytophthora oleae TaxID=2107226 RepID=A0ABD3ES90_9STRA